MNKTIAVFGGSHESTLKKLAKQHGCSVLFHNGKTRNGGNKKEFKNIIKIRHCCLPLWSLRSCKHGLCKRGL